VDQQALVERARQGDHDAFAVLVRASAARLDAAARLILRDRELAGDAVQEAFIRAWRNLPGLRDVDRFALPPPPRWPPPPRCRRRVAAAASPPPHRPRRRVNATLVS
jgi:Sigma-70 region 2